MPKGFKGNPAAAGNVTKITYENGNVTRYGYSMGKRIGWGYKPSFRRHKGREINEIGINNRLVVRVPIPSLLKLVTAYRANLQSS